MSSINLNDLDALVLRCRSSRARSYLAEAASCYKAGANRAAILMTWLAVVVDLVTKLDELALGGDQNARQWCDKLSDLVRRQDTRQALDLEQTILNVARDDFELIGKLESMDLERLREDRHRCAHPSMLDEATDFQPSGEAARYHIVNAVTHLLEHAPAQGKAALDRLLGELNSSLFPQTAEELVVHLQSGPLGRARVALVRNYVILLLKDLFSSPAPQGDSPLDRWRAGAGRQQRVHRLLLSLQAVSRMYLATVCEVLKAKFEDFASHATDTQLDLVIFICGALPDAWSTLSEGQKQRLHRFVVSAGSNDVAALTHVADGIRELRPSLDLRLSRLTAVDWAALAQYPLVLAEWLERAVVAIEHATGWSDANSVKPFLVARASSLHETHVRRILAVAAAKPEVRTSWCVQDTLYSLGTSPEFGPQRLLSLLAEYNLQEHYNAEHWFKTIVGTVQAEGARG